VAAGDTLPLAQDQISICGHAIEARIYAEDPEQDFLPASGRLQLLRTPPEDSQLRIDSGVREGSEITPHYDPMIAKLICSGESREDARRRLVRALRDYRVGGISNNLAFLYSIASSDGFREADLDTAFIERHSASLFRRRGADLRRDLSAAALVLRAAREKQAASHDPHSPWAASSGWRMNAEAQQRFEVLCHGEEHLLTLTERDTHQELRRSDETWELRGSLDGQLLRLEVDGHQQRALLWEHEGEYGLYWDDGAVHFRERLFEAADDAASAGSPDFAAPMHGTVVALLASPGEHVDAGDPVIVIEAMKMEQTLRAPVAGTVDAFHVAAGDLVDRGEALVAFSAEAAR
jgi:3-methylcrotonyl-CoA carboxylase alpha subunit